MDRITPEMIEAGVRQLRPYYNGLDADEVVQAVWTAMAKRDRSFVESTDPADPPYRATGTLHDR